MLEETVLVWPLIPPTLFLTWAILYILHSARKSAMSGGRNRFDTPEKAIAREKRRFVEGEITLSEFEDRVYQKIPVEDQ